MKYDPIKNVFAKAVARNTFLRKVFYRLLDLMFLRSWHVRKMIRQIFPDTKKKIDIYDAGMGFGQYSYFLAKRYENAAILGVDVKEDQVEDCNYFFSKTGYNKAKFEIADLTKINIESKYDFILSVDVMEHIEEDELVFRNFHKALKPGGKLLINTPSNLGGSDAHDESDESFIEEHARLGYSREDITDKLKRSGLTVTQFKYAYGKYGTIAWRWGIKYPILIAGASKILILTLPFYYLFTLWFVLVLMWMDLNTDNPEGTGVTLVAEKI